MAGSATNWIKVTFGSLKGRRIYLSQDAKAEVRRHARPGESVADTFNRMREISVYRERPAHPKGTALRRVASSRDKLGTDIRAQGHGGAYTVGRVVAVVGDLYVLDTTNRTNMDGFTPGSRFRLYDPKSTHTVYMATATMAESIRLAQQRQNLDPVHSPPQRSTDDDPSPSVGLRSDADPPVALTTPRARPPVQRAHARDPHPSVDALMQAIPAIGALADHLEPHMRVENSDVEYAMRAGEGAGRGDALLALIQQSQGFDRRPHIMADDAFDEAAQSGAIGAVGGVLLRGTGSAANVAAYRDGPLFSAGDNGRMFGAGTYTFATTNDPAVTRQARERMVGYGAAKGSQLTMALRNDARTVDWTDALRQRETWLRDNRAELKARQQRGDIDGATYKQRRNVLDMLARDVGYWAAAMGYDAIVTKPGDYHYAKRVPLVVVLNRGAVVVRDHTRDLRSPQADQRTAKARQEGRDGETEQDNHTEPSRERSRDAADARAGERA